MRELIFMLYDNLVYMQSAKSVCRKRPKTAIMYGWIKLLINHSN